MRSLWPLFYYSQTEIIMITILMSGGIDSFVAAQYFVHLNNVNALFIDYGQPSAKQEKVSARFCANYFNIPFVTKQIQIENKQMHIGAKRPGPRVVPGRNKAFIKAAITDKTESVVIGCIKDDFFHYEDCRRDYFTLLEMQLKIKIITPLIFKTKKEVVRQGRTMPLQMTWSCYESNYADPCGVCNSCNERFKALKQL